jgi:hypothetical protein
MRKESGKSAMGPIKHCGGSVHNFTDDVRLERLIASENLLPKTPTM